MNESKIPSRGDETTPLGERWSARPGDDGPEAQAGALFRQAMQRQPLDDGRLAAIRGRLRRRTGERPPRRHWGRQVAIALALVCSGGALATAAGRFFHWPVFGSAPRPIPVVSAPRIPPARRQPLGAAAPTAVAPAATLALLDEPFPQHLPSRRPPAERPAPATFALPATTPTPPPGEAARPEESPLAQESKLLGEALRRLRQDDDPRGALASLDDHDARFPAGTLAPEATLARIEALTRARRNTEALALLDRLAPAPSGSERGLLITRAELRAAAGRRAAAALDFDRLLRGDPPFDALTERALWGRASCRAATGDTAGARVDLQDYLARFPTGRFAAEARATLGQ